MDTNQFVIHACQQALRFSSGPEWSELSNERQMQVSFNVGVIARGLSLSKTDGYDALATWCDGEWSAAQFHAYGRFLVDAHNIAIAEENVVRCSL